MDLLSNSRQKRLSLQGIMLRIQRQFEGKKKGINLKKHKAENFKKRLLSRLIFDFIRCTMRRRRDVERSLLSAEDDKEKGSKRMPALNNIRVMEVIINANIRRRPILRANISQISFQLLSLAPSYQQHPLVHKRNQLTHFTSLQAHPQNENIF